MYDGHLLAVEWNDETQCYDVWYDGDHIGTVKDEKEAREALSKFTQQRDAWKYVITLILEDETS